MARNVKNRWSQNFDQDCRPRDIRLRELLEIIDAGAVPPKCCPACGSRSMVRHGRTDKGTVRYRCKSCAKTFTGSGITVGSKLDREQWHTFAVCYVDGGDMKDAAARCGVSLSSVYRMRNRIDEALAEADEEECANRRVQFSMRYENVYAGGHP